MKTEYRPGSYLAPDPKQLRDCGRSFAILSALRAAQQTPERLIPYLTDWAEKMHAVRYEEQMPQFAEFNRDAKAELKSAGLQGLKIAYKLADRMLQVFAVLGSAREFSYAHRSQRTVERAIEMFMQVHTDDQLIARCRANGWTLDS